MLAAPGIGIGDSIGIAAVSYRPTVRGVVWLRRVIIIDLQIRIRLIKDRDKVVLKRLSVPARPMRSNPNACLMITMF